MGSIYGTVKSKAGIARPEVTVLIDSGPAHPDIAAVADESGRFWLTGLSDGNYQVSAYVDGVRQASQQVLVRGNAAAAVQLELDDRL